MAQRSLILLTLLLGACGGSELETLDPALYTSTPTWAADVGPLMCRSCAACHAGDGLRAGGVEVDSYEAAWSARVKDACVTVGPDVVARFSDALRGIGPGGVPTAKPCEGWAIGSMPTGALPPVTLAEQVLLARWVELGGPP